MINMLWTFQSPEYKLIQGDSAEQEQFGLGKTFITIQDYFILFFASGFLGNQKKKNTERTYTYGNKRMILC